MKKTLLISILVFICHLTILAQAVYVDSNIGDDKNEGTAIAPVFSIKKAADIIKRQDNDIYIVKINPGIYVLDSHISVASEKEMTGKSIIIQASILPDSSLWTPEKMPIVINTSRKGEIPGADYNFVVSFLIDESHVAVRGIKFHGYYYPNTRYFPIARFNKAKTDLLVEQCMFVGDKDASHIQVGIIAHGNEIKIDHCVFYNAKNSVVFWEDSGNGVKNGNSLTNSIIFGAFQSAVWTAWPDKDFKFENNIVSNCRYAWVRNSNNTTVYSIDNCVIVNNQYFQGIPDNTGVNPGQFDINENNVVKEGDISLQLISANVDAPLPINYLHIIPSSLGYDVGAGLFKKKEPSSNDFKALGNPNKFRLLNNYPNPFNPTTTIRYTLDKSSQVKMTIYNLLGQEIRTLNNSFQAVGEYSLVWDAKDENKFPVSSGMYFYRLETNDCTLQKKMVLLK